MKCSQSNIHWAQTERAASNTRETISKNLKITEQRYPQTGKDWGKNTHTQIYEEQRQVEVIGIDQWIEVERKEQRPEQNGNFQRKSNPWLGCIFSIIVHARTVSTSSTQLQTQRQKVLDGGDLCRGFSLRCSLVLPRGRSYSWSGTCNLRPALSNDLVVDLVASLNRQLGADSGICSQTEIQLIGSLSFPDLNPRVTTWDGWMTFQLSSHEVFWHWKSNFRI